MKVFLVVVVIIAILGIGGFYLYQNRDTNSTPSINQSEVENEVRTVEGYRGNVLAGSTTPFIDFNQADYERALADGKVVVLNFYANWCPICRAEQPEIFEGFNTLQLTNVVGFQVNYKDDQTDSAEKELADQFKIPYQHTKVILVDGQEVFNETIQWDSEDLVSTVTQYATK
jgi:thioredoxin 1